MNAHALKGRRILVTRSLEDSERWAAALARLGAEPVVYPCLVCELVDDASTAEALRGALADAAWLVVTSARGAHAVARLLGRALAAHVRVAAIGSSTARAAVEHLGRVDLVANVSTAGALGTELAGLLRDAPPRDRTVVVAGAVGGREDAEAGLAAAGVPVRRIDVYRTLPVAPVAPRRELAADGIDDVLLASPSAVQGLVNSAVLPDGARVITIGPTTSAAATAAGFHVAAEARRPDLDGMLEAMS